MNQYEAVPVPVSGTPLRGVVPRYRSNRGAVPNWFRYQRYQCEGGGDGGRAAVWFGLPELAGLLRVDISDRITADVSVGLGGCVERARLTVSGVRVLRPTAVRGEVDVTKARCVVGMPAVVVVPARRPARVATWALAASARRDKQRSEGGTREPVGAHDADRSVSSSWTLASQRAAFTPSVAGAASAPLPRSRTLYPITTRGNGCGSLPSSQNAAADRRLES